MISYVYWYSLDSDADDPLIPEGCYRAPTQSRWNTPEFMAIFADTVRKVATSQTTKHMWKGNAPKWRIDMQAICDAQNKLKGVYGDAIFNLKTVASAC
jgi:hypothetical protein